MTSKTPVRVAEDVDESSLNYAEIKALATGNPLIKEKMDLDMEVNKLRMLEANYKSNLYRLEDKITKEYPAKISKMEKYIENVKEDISKIEPKSDNEDKFTSIEINGTKIYDKKEAGEELLKAIKGTGISDEPQIIGSYRGFKLLSNFDFYEKKYKCLLENKEKYYLCLKYATDTDIRRFTKIQAKANPFDEDWQAYFDKREETTLAL